MNNRYDDYEVHTQAPKSRVVIYNKPTGATKTGPRRVNYTPPTAVDDLLHDIYDGDMSKQARQSQTAQHMTQVHAGYAEPDDDQYDQRQPRRQETSDDVAIMKTFRGRQQSPLPQRPERAIVPVISPAVRTNQTSELPKNPRRRKLLALGWKKGLAFGGAFTVAALVSGRMLTVRYLNDQDLITKAHGGVTRVYEINKTPYEVHAYLGSDYVLNVEVRNLRTGKQTELPRSQFYTLKDQGDYNTLPLEMRAQTDDAGRITMVVVTIVPPRDFLRDHAPIDYMINVSGWEAKR